MLITMASRDIANMHLFLDLKKSFPDLPDDTLRQFAFLYAEDKEKCIQLLQKESENHHHPSQPFFDFRTSEIKTSPKNGNAKVPTVSQPIPAISIAQSIVPSDKLLCDGIHHLSTSNKDTSSNFAHSPRPSVISSQSKPKVQSSPVVAAHEASFPCLYKEGVPEAASDDQSPSKSDNQFIFSTTKEHTVPSLLPSNNAPTCLPTASDQERSKRHEVKLNITPSFPFHQQQMNVLSNTVSSSSHFSRPGRHITSVNFQLQPYPSDKCPLEISTVPTDSGKPCNYQDFGSHIQISIGSQGATFTALRLQRPPAAPQKSGYAEAQNSLQPVLPSLPSSHEQCSQVYKHPNQVYPQPVNPRLGGVHHELDRINDTFLKDGKFSDLNASQSQHSQKDLVKNDQLRRPQERHQMSPDYIEAVKSHQLSRLDLILKEVEKTKALCAHLQAEVSRMEQEVAEKRFVKPSLSNFEMLQKLREENRKLSIEISCLSMEVDMCSNGQIPLGETDADFYSNIFTGPKCVLTPSLKSESEHKTSVEDDDEQNRWLCKKCTFANHPALEKCEMCELPKDSGLFFNDA